MIEIGGKPIIWHIMKIYSHYGINDFIICLGYKGYLIKEYFSNYFLHNSDVTIDIKNNSTEIHNVSTEPWKVSLIHTGVSTMTGGRLKNISKYLDNETFCFTYGDGLANVNINELIDHHKNNKLEATVTAVKPPGRYGALEQTDGIATNFIEKPAGDGAWINGGFFILEPSVIDYLEGIETVWEKEPLEKLVKKKQLSVFTHNGFWQPMDTLREKKYLENLWDNNKAPWKIW